MDTDNKYGCLATQESTLPLLRDFDEFCNSNGIIYSVECGTMLGTIRHQGYIPWDDDLDFAISRDEMNRLISVIDKSEKLRLVRDLWFYRVTYKEGMYKGDYPEVPEVTFFIWDKTYNNKLLQKLKIIRLLILQQTFKVRPASTVKPFSKWLRLFVGWLMGAPFSYDWKFKHFNSVCTLGSKDSKYVSCYGYWPRDLKIKHKADLMHRIHRDYFEGIPVNVMDDFDEHLTALYGNYMTPPSENHRKTTHTSDQDWS